MLVKQKRPGCMGLLVVWVASALSLWLTAYFVPGFEIVSFKRALVVAVVLGLLNALVRPILVLLTLPITLLTLGLFLICINAIMLLLAARLLDGVQVSGFGAALIAALVLSLVSALLSRLVGGESEDAD
jgi:putative membrane protein